MNKEDKAQLKEEREEIERILKGLPIMQDMSKPKKDIMPGWMLLKLGMKKAKHGKAERNIKPQKKYKLEEPQHPIMDHRANLTIMHQRWGMEGVYAYQNKIIAIFEGSLKQEGDVTEEKEN